jgi:hypothetical protein
MPALFPGCGASVRTIILWQQIMAANYGSKLWQQTPSAKIAADVTWGARSTATSETRMS